MTASSTANAGTLPRVGEATRPDQEVIRVGSPVSLLAAVPVVLGSQPSGPSIAVLGTMPPRFRVAVTVRCDIVPGPGHARAIARYAAGILAEQGVKDACAVGYGPDSLVTPVAGALRAQFAAAGIALREILRAHDGLYWSYVCADPGCCPSRGTEYDLRDHPVTRKYASRVLPSRQELAASVAPAAGEAAEEMRRAVRAARQRASRLAARTAARATQGTLPGGTTLRGALLAPRLKAVTAAIGLYRSGGKLASPRDAAWLALALTEPEVRDDAWARMLPGHARDHLRLWTDLTVLAPGGYAAAPAALLAFVAWQSGDGALGNVALDRALADDPRYRMAVLIRNALDAGAPPSMARLPMTPEEVAAAYGYAAQHGETSDAKASRSGGRKQQRQRRRRQPKRGEAPDVGAPAMAPATATV
jgi:hypothetical protein